MLAYLTEAYSENNNHFYTIYTDCKTVIILLQDRDSRDGCIVYRVKRDGGEHGEKRRLNPYLTNENLQE